MGLLCCTNTKEQNFHNPFKNTLITITANLFLPTYLYISLACPYLEPYIFDL